MAHPPLPPPAARFIATRMPWSCEEAVGWGPRQNAHTLPVQDKNQGQGPEPPARPVPGPLARSSSYPQTRYPRGRVRGRTVHFHRVLVQGAWGVGHGGSGDPRGGPQGADLCLCPCGLLGGSNKVHTAPGERMEGVVSKAQKENGSRGYLWAPQCLSWGGERGTGPHPASWHPSCRSYVGICTLPRSCSMI